MKKLFIASSMIGALLLSGAGCGQTGSSASGDSAQQTATYTDSVSGKEVVTMKFPSNWKFARTDSTGAVTLEPIGKITYNESGYYTDGTPDSKLYINEIPKEQTTSYKDWQESFTKMYHLKTAENVKPFMIEGNRKTPGYEYIAGAAEYTDLKFNIAFWSINYMVVFQAPAKTDAIDKIMGSVYMQ